MAFCGNCGQQLDDEAVICPYCHTSQRSAGQPTGYRANNAAALKGNQRTLKIVIIVLIAASFLYGLIGGLRGTDGLAVKAAEKYMTEVERSRNNGTVTVTHTKPRLLDHTGDVYYLYTEITIAYSFSDKAETTGGIIVLKIDNKISGTYTVITDVPLSGTDEEHIQSGLEICKQLYSNK